MGFLRELFGPSREEVWRQLADQIGGHYVDGGFWSGGKVVIHHGQWTITVDVFVQSSGQHSQTYTRLRAPYINADGFRFTVYRKSVFSNLGKLFGMQDVQVGCPDFDEQFIIQGTDEAKLQALLADERLRSLMELQPDLYLTVKDDEGWFRPQFPEGVDELYVQTLGVIKDLDRLESLYYLFAECLNHLCHIGSAYEDDPKLEL